MIVKKDFYNFYRKSFGKIMLAATVETINEILDYGFNYGCTITQLAYILATASHEARDRKYPNDFYPLTERGSRKYISKYWWNLKLRGWLGNLNYDDAWKYRGRGLVQLTGRVNYKKFGLELSPEKALEPETSVMILVNGMMKGKFTGAKLTRYIYGRRKDYLNARRVVNGLDRAGHIADKAIAFESMLKKSLIPEFKTNLN